MHIRRWTTVLGTAVLLSLPAAAAEASVSTGGHPASRPAIAPASRPSTAPASRPSSAPASRPSSTSASSSSNTSSRPSASSTSQSTKTTTTPAPAARSEAYALVLANILAISHSKTSASGGGTSSTANPLEIGGKPLATQFGGTQTGAGTSSGHLIDIGQPNQFRLAVTPWSATNTQSSSQNTANAIADVLILGLGNPSTSQSASLRVLESRSSSTWTSGASSSNTSTDGAILNVGGASGLTVDLLHAETSSSGKGSSYLVSINGNQIGSSGQASGKCTITIPGLLDLACLTATGGTAGSVTTAGSGVAKAVLGSGTSKLTAGLFQTSSGFGTGLSASAPSSAPTLNSASASAPAAKSSGALAFTGVNPTMLLLIVGLLLLAGGFLVAWTRSARFAHWVLPFS
jgi:hypothetical protein